MYTLRCETFQYPKLSTGHIVNLTILPRTPGINSFAIRLLVDKGLK